MVEGKEAAAPAASDAEALLGVTDREKEILRLIFDGRCANEVARMLAVSKRTVDFHIARVYKKIGAANRFEAYRRAVELGILET